MLLVNAVNTEGRPVELFVRDGKIAAVGQDLEALAGENEVVLDAGGLTVLPAFVAAQDASLCAVLPDAARFTRTFWMSMPAENKHVARMQAVWDFVRQTVQARQGLLLPA